MKIYLSLTPCCGVCGYPCERNPILPPAEQAPERPYGLATFWCQNRNCPQYQQELCIKADLVDAARVVTEQVQ